MRSKVRGTNISEAEVTNISTHGFWILIHNKEYFLPFSKFPWFSKARIDEITKVELLHSDHLYWESLDIDLTIEMIEHPDKYPLVSN